MTWLGPIVGISATYVASRHSGPWAAALVSGLSCLTVVLWWSRRAGGLGRTVDHYRRLALTDDLTGLANDRSFREDLRQGLIPDRLNSSPSVGWAPPADPLAPRGDRWAVPTLRDGDGPMRFGFGMTLALVDVDEFKSYNDTFGHPAGDAVLKEIGGTLLAIAGETSRAYRLGGDEFALIFPGSDGTKARELAERMRAAIESHAWPLRPITASFGLATIDRPLPGEDTSTILGRADRALYQAKREGGNRVVDHAPP